MSLFEPIPADSAVADIVKKGIWDRIKSLFTGPAYEGLEGEEDEEEGAGWDDVSGSGWVDRNGNLGERGAGGEGQGGRRDGGRVDHEAPDRGRGGGGARAPGAGDLDFDDVDDLLETGLILFIGFAIMGLVWVRQRWAVGGGAWAGVGAEEMIAAGMGR